MRRLTSPRWLAWLFAAAELAGCFTEPINRQPSVQLTPPGTSIMRGKDASFTVVATDPDGDPLMVSWGVVAGDCPIDVQSWQGDRRPLGAGERQVVVESSATLAPFCVCVFAVDSHNATDANCLPQTPVNRAPDIQLRVVEPNTLPRFPLFSRVRVSAAGTVDPDAAPGEMILYSWNLDRPPGSSAALEGCGTATDLERCFTGDARGTYTVTLEARDGMGEKSRAMVPVEIAEDRLPCIRETTPALTSLIRDDSPDAPRSLSVTKVDDDGNPYPASSSGRIQFTWFAGLEGGPMSYLGNDFESFTPVGYQLGDVVRVRVEIRDRNVKTIDDILTRCQMSGDALCESPPGSGCFLSATWTVRFNL